MIGQDPGHNGPLVSLGGIVGRPGYGSFVEHTQPVVTAGTFTDVVGNNPKRLWMFIQNESTEAVLLYFGNVGAGSVGLRLEPKGTLQIDEHIPWTGGIRIGAPTVNATIEVIEASLAS